MLSSFFAIFLSVFLAELGDKTQLATLLFAADPQRPPILVFLAAACALLTATALAVIAGGLFERYLEALPLKAIAGVGFIAIGIWSLYGHFTAT
ncbi:MAG: TMEM165/GDT1 family protein [Rhodovibrionaceae bacterium]